MTKTMQANHNPTTGELRIYSQGEIVLELTLSSLKGEKGISFASYLEQSIRKTERINLKEAWKQVYALSLKKVGGPYKI